MSSFATQEKFRHTNKKFAPTSLNVNLAEGLRCERLSYGAENFINDEHSGVTHMFGIFKFFYFLFQNARRLLDPNLNPLRHAPVYVRYIASILLFCFWCLAFGLYIGDPLSIPYNMLGHIAVISMAFITWAVFKQSTRIYGPRAGTQDWLRSPDRSSRCDEMTDEQRDARVKDLSK